MVSDAERRALFGALESQLGGGPATTMMELLPLDSSDELARRSDVALLRGEVQGVRVELRAEMAELRGRMDRLEGRIDGLEGRIDGMLGRLMVSQFAATVVAAATVIAAIKL